MRPPIQQRGLTLLELLVTISILGVLATLAVPAFTTFMTNSRLRAVADNLQSGLHVARMEALKRNETTALLILDEQNNWMINRAYHATSNPTVDSASITRSANSTACAGGASTPASYQLRRSCGESQGVTLASNFSSTNPGVLFDSQGRAWLLSGDSLPSLATFELCASGASSQYSIAISAGGQARSCNRSISSATDPRYCDPSLFPATSSCTP